MSSLDTSERQALGPIAQLGQQMDTSSTVTT